MSRLRILVLAPDANPESISLALEGFSHSEALARLHCVTLVARAGNEQALRKAQAPYQAIEAIDMPWLERFYGWCIRHIFNNNFHSRVLTPFSYPFSLAFEWKAWWQLRKRILAGEWDVVLRVLPMTPSLPSLFASFLRKGPIPFVLGPLNGGLPWPAGFEQLEKQKEWISGLRNVYQYLPFGGSTYRHATAIIGASSQVCFEFSKYSDKVFFVPEPGMAASQCAADTRTPQAGDKLELIFVGGLVPRKACNLALRAAAPLLRSGVAHFTVVGDGPERKDIEHLVVSLGIENEVTMCGWVSHEEVLKRLRSADVLVFPSLRDNGAGIVFEALASGAVPVVADFGGPGDIVNSEVGYKVPLTNENDIVAQIEKVLNVLANDRNLLQRLRRQGMAYVQKCLTWDAKALATTRVLQWVVRRGPKPDLPPPKILYSRRTSSS